MLSPTSEKTNCFVVTWGDAAEVKYRKAAATTDGTAYIEELWASFLKETTGRKRKRDVNRILIVQDYYDYDNKMSVWYILYAFHAQIIELFSVTRPVADKAVMHAMRENRSAFDVAGGIPAAFTPGPLTEDAKNAWEVKGSAPTYPVAGPVFTQSNFNVGSVELKGQTFAKVIVEEKELSFERFKMALAMNPDRIRESEEEAAWIASTWMKFIGHMLKEEIVGNQGAACSVTNGGHTMRHGLNPAMHTVVEDWYKDERLPVGTTLPVTPSNTTEPDPKRVKTK
jgi:hypothetical protein